MAQQVGPVDDCNWSYPGSNTNVPTIMVFRPTWEEFKDFNKYMKVIESVGAQHGGIAKIIPPKEWNPRKAGYKLDEGGGIGRIKIPDPICQMIDGNRGIFQSINVRKRALNVAEFQTKANSSQYRTPPYVDYEDLERRYWKNVTFVPPIYGADVPGSITDKECNEWNIQRLGSCLDWVNQDYNVKIDGVNTAYLYFGMWKTTFAWHTEDMDLHSINYLHYGESKFWYTVPPEHARRFERMAAGLFPNLIKDCPAYLRHKMCLISPNILRQNSIPYNKIVQKEGEFMVTFPMGYHSGFNTGFNIAESTNFATERWVEYGKRSNRCYCRPDNVHISMDCFVKRLQPERYDLWIKGQDYGRHPEEPNAKPTPAQPPSAEEFFFNPQNKGKAIPQCLLEPRENKKRRHPIHKKKALLLDLDCDELDLDKKRLKLSLKRIDEDSKMLLLTNRPVVVPMLAPSNKLNFNTHPTFGTLPTKNEFGSGSLLASNNSWPSTPVLNNSSRQDLKMTETVKQKWMSSFLTPGSGRASTLPSATRPPSACTLGQYPGLVRPSLTATISKLQNAMPQQQQTQPQASSYSCAQPPPSASNQYNPPKNNYYIQQPHTDKDLTQRQSMYPEELRKVLQSTGVLNESASTASPNDKMAVLLDPRFAQSPSPTTTTTSTTSTSTTSTSTAPPFPTLARSEHADQQVLPTIISSPKVLQNKAILSANMERPILSNMLLIDRSSWRPPMRLPEPNYQVLAHWHLKGSVNVAKGEMYVRFVGPQNANRSFCLQFSNILGTSKRHQNNVSVWPPSDNMMDQCEDLSRWTISAGVDPYRDIKATVIDPWEKAYLLTIPVKLLQQR